MPEAPDVDLGPTYRIGAEVQMVLCDGGLITGPGYESGSSPRGGTWAFCWCDTTELIVPDPETHMLSKLSGIIRPEKHGLDVVSNNQSEFYALAKALRLLPRGWSGKVVSDSQITLNRWFSSWKMRGIPKPWARQMGEILQRIDAANCQVVLVDGHPTKKHLACGIGKRGGPCSNLQHWCDKRCCLENQMFLKGQGLL